MANYTVKYKRVDQLLDEVAIDFPNMSLENMITPAQLIKVARRVNYDLGLRIYKTKEVLLELDKGKVRLPDDFFVFNFAMLCGSYTTTFAVPQGTHIEERSIPKFREQPATIDICAPPVICSGCNTTPCGCKPTSASIFGCNQPQTCSCNTVPCQCAAASYNPLVPYGNYCNKPRVFMNCKGDCFELIQMVKTETRTYHHITPLNLLESAEGIECGCPGLYMRCADQVWIKDGFLYANFASGNVYLNYEGLLEDDDGNLLVMDHEEISMYYEYALKQRILENLMFNDENVINKLQYVQVQLREARNRALSIVNTPNFSEMRAVWQLNRKAQYYKYYQMFSSYPWFRL